MATIKAPIWQDIYYTVSATPTATTFTAFDYAVQLPGGRSIYTGRANLKPNATYVSINISKICRDYIKDTFSQVDFRTLTGQTYLHPQSYVEFNLVNLVNGEVLATYGFVYDWSYEDWDGNDRTVSNPINGHSMAGMYAFHSSFNGVLSGITTQVGNIAGSNACGEIALYYKNRKGGWDSFLIEGTWTKTDSYTKYTYNRSFDNNTLEFENGTYHSQIITSYQLNTGWLNDQESKNLAFNLLSSNEVYLHNLCEDKVYPVVITDNTATYKTYKNNQRRLVNYQINCEESQRKEVL